MIADAVVTTWPQAVVIVAFFVMVAFIVWAGSR